MGMNSYDFFKTDSYSAASKFTSEFLANIQRQSTSEKAND